MEEHVSNPLVKLIRNNVFIRKFKADFLSDLEGDVKLALTTSYNDGYDDAMSNLIEGIGMLEDSYSRKQDQANEDSEKVEYTIRIQTVRRVKDLALASIETE